MADRVPLLPMEKAREVAQQLGLAERFARGGAFRTLAHNPDLAKAVYGQLTTLLLHNKLDTRLRELMIMRIGWVTGSEYEWTQHWRVATEAGIPAEDILAVRDWRKTDRLTAADRAVLTATDESLAGKTISDATWAEVTKHITNPAEQVEFVVALGNWTLFSILLRNLRVPLENGITGWPPDGKVAPAAQGG
ncbi:MAG: carboxymuconolactone decarboxylase family protein [Acetobacteraceae bacterium]